MIVAMTKRRIICGFFLTLVLLSTLGWIWSWTHYTNLTYSHGGARVECTSADNTFSLGFGWGAGLFEGWECVSFSHAPHYWPSSETSNYGFRIGEFGRTSNYNYFVGVPYWCLILLFSLALPPAWWLTRPKKLSGAFPVEVAPPPDPASHAVTERCTQVSSACRACTLKL